MRHPADRCVDALYAADWFPATNGGAGEVWGHSATAIRSLPRVVHRNAFFPTLISVELGRTAPQYDQVFGPESYLWAESVPTHQANDRMRELFPSYAYASAFMYA